MSKNPENDLWLDFISEVDQPEIIKESAKDGTEWRGAFDRRKEPRTQTPEGLNNGESSNGDNYREQAPSNNMEGETKADKE